MMDFFIELGVLLLLSIGVSYIGGELNVDCLLVSVAVGVAVLIYANALPEWCYGLTAIILAFEAYMALRGE